MFTVKEYYNDTVIICTVETMEKAIEISKGIPDSEVINSDGLAVYRNIDIPF